MNKQNMVKMVCFLILACLAVHGCSLIAFRNLRGFNDHTAFYECAEDSVDVIFLGGSMSYCTFSPMELYEKHGISSYNFGTSNQYLLSSYIWAKEAVDYQDIDVIVVEAMTIPMSHGDIANDIRSLFSMGINKNYLSLATVYKRNAWKVLFPILVLHDGWTIDESTFAEVGNPNAKYLRGYVPLDSQAGEEYTESILTGDENATEYLKYTYLDKLRELCEENDIELIVVKALQASNETNRWNDGYHNLLVEYAEKNDITFIDFNSEEYIEKIGFDISTDVAADLRHMNKFGAAKASDFLGQYILQMEGVEINCYQDELITEEVLEKYHELVGD